MSGGPALGGRRRSRTSPHGSSSVPGWDLSVAAGTCSRASVRAASVGGSGLGGGMASPVRDQPTTRHEASCTGRDPLTHQRGPRRGYVAVLGVIAVHVSQRCTCHHELSSGATSPPMWGGPFSATPGPSAARARPERLEALRRPLVTPLLWQEVRSSGTTGSCVTSGVRALVTCPFRVNAVSGRQGMCESLCHGRLRAQSSRASTGPRASSAGSSSAAEHGGTGPVRLSRSCRTRRRVRQLLEGRTGGRRRGAGATSRGNDEGPGRMNVRALRGRVSARCASSRAPSG